MLYISTELSQIKTFTEKWRSMFSDMLFLDLSKHPSSNLASESSAIVSHQSNCCVFLGYIEPGWMLEPTHQVILRKLIRKFPVAMVSFYMDSIPFSWKNETEVIYMGKPLNSNGTSDSVDDGGSIQGKPKD
jgi:hypothetical protein